MLYLFLKPTRLGDTFWRLALPALSAMRQRHTLRYRFAQDRTLSAVAYLLLRMGLREEYGMEVLPEYRVEPRGKPLLHNSTAHFSFSHCPQAVICAVYAEPVGADVESWTAFAPERQPPGLLERVFSPDEQKRIRTASTPEQVACALWTAKESVCKYTGEGLTDDLPSVLRRTDVRDAMQVDAYTFTGLSAAVCRRARANMPPLPCREVSPDELHRFLQHCLCENATLAQEQPPRA